jgi:hypothetical protein
VRTALPGVSIEPNPNEGFMTGHISGPIFIAIEQHRRAAAAFDDSLDRGADESVKDARQKQEAAALITLLRTKPETLAGCLAALRYVPGWAEDNEAGLFHDWSGPQRSAGAAFLPTAAGAIEAGTR